MLNTRMAKLRDTEGFTLIELLIVVVIIGILAAIAIPQFSSTKEKAYDATAKSDLRNLMTAQEAYFADEQQYATDIVEGDPTSNAMTFSPSSGVGADNITIEENGDRSGYCATAQHDASSNIYGVEVGDGDDDDTDGSGEVAQVASAGDCPTP